MKNEQFYKSVLDQDISAIVICNLEHEIVYMNPVAISRYEKWGGAKLLGQNLMKCHNPNSQEMIIKVLDWFKASKEHNRIYTYHNDNENKDVYMVALREDDGTLIGYYEKHEYRNLESAPKYDMN